MHPLHNAPLRSLHRVCYRFSVDGGGLRSGLWVATMKQEAQVESSSRVNELLRGKIYERVTIKADCRQQRMDNPLKMDTVRMDSFSLVHMSVLEKTSPSHQASHALALQPAAGSEDGSPLVASTPIAQARHANVSELILQQVHTMESCVSSFGRRKFTKLLLRSMWESATDWPLLDGAELVRQMLGPNGSEADEALCLYEVLNELEQEAEQELNLAADGMLALTIHGNHGP